MPSAPPDVGTSVAPWSQKDGRLSLLDQRRLPHEEVVLECASAAETAEAIRSLVVRGAPLIGVAAAFGMAIEARRVAARSEEDLDEALARAAVRLRASRPTAVNLAAAVARMERVAQATRALSGSERAERLLAEAEALAEEDRLSCLALSRLGAAWLEARLPAGPEPLCLLTHCNAGALATAGIGSALGIVRVLASRRRVAILADETRPFWQGARLTAWELQRDGLDVTLVPDVAAASLIGSGEVHAVIVGADRIAANGDVANKVGTYGLALACNAHRVPFVVAAPLTTLDLACPDGRAIPIERRSGDEVLLVTPVGAPPVRVAPEGVKALYPAFDVTPAALVGAIVTEAGISTPPHADGLAELARGRPRT